MNIPVTFFINNAPTIRLKWPAVPRKGETVDLAVVNPQMPHVYMVDDVLWRHVAGDIDVSVYCKEIK